MAHKVFVCHSSKDKPVAEAACAALEAHDIPCWIAPRDVLAGEDYAASIIESLEETLIVLLIFSVHANDSPHVRREIERAVSKDKIIVVFRIEDVRPSRAMEFALSNTQWLNAITPPLESRLSELCTAAARLVQKRTMPNPPPIGPFLPPDAEDPDRSATESPTLFQAFLASFQNLLRNRPWTVAVATTVALGVLIWCGVLWWHDHQIYHPNPEAQQWFNEGVKSLQEGSYSNATRSLDAAIKQDPQFAMAYARLAEAWLDLDFQASAQREMLLAARGEERLSSLDRSYYNAIQASVTGDFAAAAVIYRDILGRIDAKDKSNGYVDLGWTDERAQQPALALKYYTKAFTLNPLNAAAAMHIGILQSRFGHVPEADQAFQEAQNIFDHASNHEGLAELDFERGYAANDRSDGKQAKAYLEKARDEAKPLNDVQLNIRILAQLSGAIDRFDPAQAVQYAEEAIREARANGLDPWAAEGLVRLAAAQLRQGNFSQAEDSVQQGLQIANESQQLRAEAMANLTLASIENSEHHPEQVVGPAQAALAFYQKNGFFTDGVNASLLLGRTARDQGHFADALVSATTAENLATQSGDHEMMRKAEELFGTTLMQMEHYPDALAHFQKARALADAESSREYESLNAAGVLWRLRQSADFEEMLRFTPLPSLASWAEVERVSALLSLQKYADALALAKHVLTEDKSIDADDREALATGETLAESHLGMKKDALAGLAVLTAKIKTDSPPAAAADNLAIAEVSLNLGHAPQAAAAAAAAATHFQAGGQLDSELRSLLLDAAAAKLTKDSAATSDFSKKALDIQSQIEQNWGPLVSQVYFSRPDLHTLLQTIR